MESSILWQPTPTRIEAAQVTQFRNFVNQKWAQALPDYAALYAWSIASPADFWQAVWEFCDIKFHTPYETVLSPSGSMLHNQWFSGAKLNYAENCLWQKGQQPALICYQEQGPRREVNYDELRAQVAKAQALLRARGITQGDRVAAFMPNTLETIVAFLATSSLGAIWSSCSPDFGVQGAVDRFSQITPKIVLACNGYHYQGKVLNCIDKVTQIAAQLPSVHTLIWVDFIELATNAPGLHWQTELEKYSGTDCEFVPLPFDHPLAILYSSGTTGAPKCIVHGAGGTLIQHLKEHRLHCDLRASDVFFYFTTCGWMMWNWLVSGLASGCTLVLYDGSPASPSLNCLWDIAAAEKITVFGTSAKYIASLHKEKMLLKQTHDVSALRLITSTGSPLLPEDFEYVYDSIKSDVCLSSISGGTDIVSCFALGSPVLPVRTGELQTRGLGLDVAIVNEQGERVMGEKGELTCQAPFPCQPIYFWNDPEDALYRKAYFSKFPGVWAHGDYAELTPSGGLIIYGRSDAVLNPGGVRIGTAEIYRQVEKLPAVLESLAIGQPWQGDVRIILFVRLREGLTLSEELKSQLKRQIQTGASPRHVPALIIQVPDLPRTLNGKLVEIAVRHVIQGLPVQNIEALANPHALHYFENLTELQ
jgi:acetoacetyl-CoA synthetase